MDDDNSLKLRFIEVAYETDVTVIEEEIRFCGNPQDLIHRSVEVRGLFSVSKELFKFSELALVKGDVFYERLLNIPSTAGYSIYDITERDGSEGINYAPTAISGIKYPVSIDNMYITAYELERFSCNKTITTCNNVTPSSTPHGNSERFAIRRESVLMAAMCVQKKYPERCVTYSEWARQIDIAAPEFWPETGKPPLEIDGVERLLSKVFTPSKWKGN